MDHTKLYASIIPNCVQVCVLCLKFGNFLGLHLRTVHPYHVIYLLISLLYPESTFVNNISHIPNYKKLMECYFCLCNISVGSCCDMWKKLQPHSKKQATGSGFSMTFLNLLSVSLQNSKERWEKGLFHDYE